MADVRVTSTGDRRVTTTGDVRITDAGLVTIITFDQQVQATIAPADIITFDQIVGEVIPAADLVAFRQVVRKDPVVIATADVVTFDQTVRVYSTIAAADLIAFDQTVRQTIADQPIITFRQFVYVPGQEPGKGAFNRTLIVLDGIDITERCSPAYSVTGSEGDNRTATVTLFPPSGAINITSYQGREIEILRRINDVWQPVFTGKVDVPTYNRHPRTLQLRCTDLRNERLGREDQTLLQTMTGGIYSEITQREKAEGQEWVRELMKTVEGSLDYTGSGALRYRDWAVATPAYALQAEDIHHREVDLEFATRSEIINRIKIGIGFRWFKRNTINAGVSAGIKRSDYCKGGQCLPAFGKFTSDGQTLPTKEAALQAAYNISNWQVVGASTGDPPPSGWYRANPLDSPIAYISSPAFQDLYATSVSASLVRWISQGMRWNDEITVESPQSIDQFEAIDGPAMSFSVDTEIDPGVFEEAGCYTKPEQDRLLDREVAIQAAEAMAAKQIRGSHRQNYVSFRYKPENGRAGAGQILPAEIGDTISVTSDEVTVTGWVSEFTHSNTRDGDAWTDIKLAVSRVDSAVSVTDNLAVPTVGTPSKINVQAIQGDPAICGPVSEEEGDTPIRSEIAMDGSITLVAPAIPAALTDELVGEASNTYQIEIPVNTFDVVVP